MPVFAWIKEHPYETAGAVFAVGVVAIVVLNSGKSAGSQGSAASDSGSLEAQELQAEEAASAQQAQEQSTSQAAQLQLDEAQLSAGVANNQIAGQVTVSNNQTGASVTINSQNDATSVDNTNTITLGHVAETGITANAQLQTALGADTANIQIAQANDAVEGLISQYSNQALEAEASDLASVSKTQSNNGLLGGIVGAISSIF